MDDEPDIVVRLRRITWIGSDALCRDAADEIERLSAAVVKLSQSSLPENVEISILRKERDEARRECCVWGSRTEMGARSLAKFKGWDCFKKEETQQAMNNIAKLDEELGL